MHKTPEDLNNSSGVWACTVYKITHIDVERRADSTKSGRGARVLVSPATISVGVDTSYSRSMGTFSICSNRDRARMSTSTLGTKTGNIAMCISTCTGKWQLRQTRVPHLRMEATSKGLQALRGYGVPYHDAPRSKRPHPKIQINSRFRTHSTQYASLSSNHRNS